MSLQAPAINALSCSIALLEQYHKVHSLSKSITLLAILSLFYLAVSGDALLLTTVLLISIVLLGFFETLYAVRIGFDLSLLRQIAEQPQSPQSALKQLDESLLQLQLISSDKTGRSLQSRLSGCRRLLKNLAALTAVQGLAVLAIGAWLISALA